MNKIKGKAKTARVDLGLAVSGATLQPGERRTLRELAAFCDCKHQALFRIEQIALRKLRVHLQFHKDPVLRDLVSTLIKR